MSDSELLKLVRKLGMTTNDVDSREAALSKILNCAVKVG
jgi:DNA polymerase sigma